MQINRFNDLESAKAFSPQIVEEETSCIIAIPIGVLSAPALQSLKGDQHYCLNGVNMNPKFCYLKITNQSVRALYKEKQAEKGTLLLETLIEDGGSIQESYLTTLSKLTAEIAEK